jgi:hypothetical protein
LFFVVSRLFVNELDWLSLLCLLSSSSPHIDRKDAMRIDQYRVERIIKTLREKEMRNHIPVYPSGKSTNVPFNFLPRKYAVLLLPSELTCGVQCLVVALTGPLCWMRHGSTLTAQLDMLFSDFLMASMFSFCLEYLITLNGRAFLVR